MLFVYPAIFHKEEDSYWVEFPDLPGCQSFGSTLNETIESAQEALSGYLLTLFEERLPIATPSDISSISEGTVDGSGFVSYVTCDINQYQDTKAIKKTLTIPSWMNDRATDLGVNFSKTLQDALLVKIQSK